MLPALSLSSCVRAYVTRSTLGATLSAEQRLNYFPATPSCVLTWLVSGSIDWVQAVEGGTRAPPPPGVLFRGPQRQPYVASAAGPMQAFICVLMPDALHALTGVDPGAWVDRVVPLEDVLGAEWVTMAQAVQRAPDDVSRVATLEAFLAPRWQAARQEGQAGEWAVARYKDWARGLAARAALSGLGRSVRQAERRIKAWAGLPMRQLLEFGRAEALFLGVHEAQREGPVRWPQVADRVGFSDQAHLCRAVRRATGFSPDEFRRRQASDEAFWLYRTWQ